jgi:hypothetical protein
MRTPVPPPDATHYIAAASSLCAGSGAEAAEATLRDAAKPQQAKDAPNRGEIVEADRVLAARVRSPRA